MADASVSVTEGSGKNIDTRTNAGGDHRQVIVVGNPTATDSVAEVQATDPTSNTLGLVVRDVNTSAIAAQLASGVAVTGTLTGITNSIAVHVLSTGGTINVQLKPGTISVSLDPGHLLGSVTANAGTGTMTVVFDPGHEIGSIKGTNSSLAVFLDPGHLLGSVTANAGTGTFTVAFDPGHELGTIKGNTNTLTVFLPDTGHEIGTIRGNTNTLTVFLPDTGHTLGKVDAGAGTFQVFLPDTGHEIGTIRGNTNTLTVFLPDTGHTLGFIQGTKTTLAVSLDPGSTLGKVDQGVGGTSSWLINSQGTASVFTASGSASGVSVSGNTVISPSANASFKIYAFSIQTTGQVSLTCKFTNGAGTGPTEYFRPLITASGVTGAQGANLSTGGPGNPLFVTGVSTTLSLLLDSATLVHYSVSYTKESA